MIQKSIYSVFILVALLFSISACKTTKTAQGGEAARSVPKVKVPKDFAFSMIKTSCRGYCPGYNMSIDANGLVKYEGTRSVKNIGKHTKQLTKDEMKMIVGAVNDAKFWDFEEKYDDENIADLPSTTVTCVMGGKQRTVFDRFKAPKELKDMEKAIETIVGEEGFTKVEDKTEEKN